MAIEMKQSVRQVQTLTISPQIQQAIKILTLGRLELEDFVSSELRENPCLEEGEPSPADDATDPGQGEESAFSVETLHMEGPLEAAVHDLQAGVTTSENVEQSADDILGRFSDSLSGGDDDGMRVDSGEEHDTPLYDRIRSEGTSLEEHLEAQLSTLRLTAYELECAGAIIDNLDKNGFVGAELEAIAVESGLPLDDIRFGLEQVQKCEPVGVGARDLRDCFLLQLKAHANPPPGLVRMLEECWPDFEKQDFARVMKAMKVKQEEFREWMRFMKENLDPRPVRNFDVTLSPQVAPDVFIFKRGDEWVVSLNEDGLPRLRVSKKYESVLQSLEPQRGKGAMPAAGGDQKAREFVNEKIRNARWIMRAIAERNRTILRVAEVILKKQQEFFEQGLEHLRPLTLRQVADELQLHESTISRTTAGKYLNSPRGMFELKYFFNAGMSGADGQELANETIKNWVASYIKEEDPASPLSDQDLANMIESQRGVKVARRTVAKYREGLGIQSSSKRVKRF